MKPLPTAHPCDLIGMRIVIIAACQHDALIGMVRMDPDAMTPLPRSGGISATPEDTF
jgi:hypothetical protein